MRYFKFICATILLLIAVVACSSGTGGEQAQAGTVSAGSNTANGKAIYRQYCVTCHGADGKLGLNGAGDLTKSVLPLDQRIIQISKGKNMMAAYEEILTAEEIRAVAKYTLTFKK